MGVARNLLIRDKKGVWGTEVSRQGHSPGGGLKIKPPEAGDKYGCRFYRNMMKNLKYKTLPILKSTQ